jgi:UDP-N-acetylglucosamine:LPS N-acetylglucosamine transferase
LPSAIDNHQLLNAINIVDLGMGLMHEESESLESLSKKLQKVIENNLYEKWSNQENNLDHFQAARRMLSSILKY